MPTGALAASIPAREHSTDTPTDETDTRPLPPQRSDLIIEVSHAVGFMGEDYVETQCRHEDVRGEGN